jgi:hypothetical protein
MDYLFELSAKLSLVDSDSFQNTSREEAKSGQRYFFGSRVDQENSLSGG